MAKDGKSHINARVDDPHILMSERIEKTSVRILASTPMPHRLQDLKFKTAREAGERIEELELIMGLPHGAPIVNIFKANDRVEQLQRLVEEQIKVRPQSPAAAITAVTSDAKLRLAASTIYSNGRKMVERSEIVTRFFSDRLTYPGCTTDFNNLDQSKIWRRNATGRDRAVTAIMQKQMNDVLKKSETSPPTNATCVTGRARTKASMTVEGKSFNA